MFRVLEDNINQCNIEIRYKFSAGPLISKDHGQVLGVRFQGTNGTQKNIKARCGVILCCGGFEANEEMKKTTLGKIAGIDRHFYNEYGRWHSYDPGTRG